MVRRVSLFLGALLLAAAALKAAETPAGSWITGYKDGGAGFFVSSPDQDFVLKLLGYAQANYIYTDSKDAKLRAGAAKPVSNDFWIRRARVDFVATLFKNDEIFVEYDGGPTSAAPSLTANQSDFALVEAKLTHKFSDALQWRMGKFLSPFSTEDSLRSSRAIDTVERYAALNALVGLPGVDVQMGTMLFGNVSGGKVAYYAGVFNGNGRVNDNFRDNNSQKELQGKLVVKPFGGSLSNASLGFGVDWDREMTQSLALKTLGGASLSTLAVTTGARTGFAPDFYLPLGSLELRGEALLVRFSAADAKLYGGFLQAIDTVWKGANGASFGPLVRVEAAVVSNKKAGSLSRLGILTVGWNAWLNKNVRWQLNYCPTSYGRKGAPGAGETTTVPHHYDEVLSEVQFKF